MRALDPVRALVEALAVDADGTVRLAERSVGRAAPGQATMFAETMAAIFYEHAYTRPYPPPPAPDIPDVDMTPLLEAANTTRGRAETGWTLLGTQPDGTVLASRHGRTRRLAAGQFVTVDGVLPAPPGAQLAVYIPAGSAARQPGFYYCSGQGFRDANDLSPLVRLYFHARAEAAAQMVTLLTAALNRYEIPFDLKVATRPSAFIRSDNSVLYLALDSFRAAALALAPVLSPLAATLAPDVPLFTKRLAPGIGFAEDPGGGDSFGMNRSRLAGRALAAARDASGFAFELFSERFVEAVKEAGLHPEALWLNPESEDIYSFTQLSPAAAAA